jgi:hypothetical protein
VLKVVEKLGTFGFNPVFLTSEGTNLNKLRDITAEEERGIKTALKGVSGIYRKRITSSSQAFLKKEEYEALLDYSTDVEKLAKMFRILGFLTQTKVYLFGKK